MDTGFQVKQVSKKMNKLDKRSDRQLRRGLSLLCILVGLCVRSLPTQAQVTSNQPTTFVDSSSPFGHIILGGAQQGENLFHSFSELNTSDGRFINFIADPSVTNIISRITDSPTAINGFITITSDGTNLSPATDLFLLSPQGITLGPNTITNIDGAFVASTATGLAFEDGTTFQTDTSTAPLLSVSAPIGLQLGTTARSVQVQGINATSPTFGLNTLTRGQNIVLVGGDINITGGANLVGGRLQLAGLSESGSVALSSAAGFLNAKLPTNVARADVSIESGSVIATSAPIEATSISARNLHITEASNLLSGALPGFPLPYKVGDINIDVTDNVELIGGNIYNGIDFGAVGDTGDINLRANSLFLSDASQIGAIGRGNGTIGSLDIQVAERIVLNGKNSLADRRTGLYSLVGDLFTQQGSGQVGDLNIRTRSLELTDGALITTSTLGLGNAGNTDIVADQILVDGVSDIDGLPSSISSSVEFTGTGDGGNVNVRSDQLRVSNGGAIFGRTQGRGNAGNVNLNVSALDVLEGGQIVTTSFTAGDAGDISITASDRITLSGTDTTYNDRIAVSLLNLLGDEASGIYANTADISSGEGGSITISAPQLLLRDSGQISVSSLGTGAAGSLSIGTSQRTQLSQGTIQAESRGGSEGNIAIASPLLLLSDNSTITTNAIGTATGGSINLDTQFIVGSDNSDIVARATQGAGGQINISSTGLIGIAARPDLTPKSDINASSDLGVDGTIAINTPNIDPDSGVVELPSNLVDSSDQLTAGCSAEQNNFVASGRGGLPISPNYSAALTRPWRDTRFVEISAVPVFSTEVTPEVSSENGTQVEIEEALGWQHNAQNEVVLLASSTPDIDAAVDCLTR